MTTLADSMHRLIKLALDSGEAENVDHAVNIFSDYKLHIYLGEGWSRTLAGQAAFLTALNTASRAFLGGVLVTGDINCTLDCPLFKGKKASAAIEELGGTYVYQTTIDIPTIVIGLWAKEYSPKFCIQIGYDGWRAGIWPLHQPMRLKSEIDNVLSGIAAAALGVNEAFLFVRGELTVAGHRTLGISLWNPEAIDDWHSCNDGPKLKYLPASLWLIGLGHLGQAYAWTLGMLPYKQQFPKVILQDIEDITESNLSTCMLISDKNIGQKKTRVVSSRLEEVGFSTTIVERQFTNSQKVQPNESTTALFGVDNVAARRAIDFAGFGFTVEAGLGSGYRDFRNIRLHVFPGIKSSENTWLASDAVQPAIHLTSVYEKLAEASGDQCGVTQLASKSVATPFVGAFASSLVLAEVIRLLHGGCTFSTIDIQMKETRHRTIAHAAQDMLRMPSFFVI